MIDDISMNALPMTVKKSAHNLLYNYSTILFISTMTEIQLNLVVIRSHDINKSVLFCQKLGLNFIKHQHGSGLEHFVSEGSLITFEIYPCDSEAS
jgi:hypothetical protein